MQHLNISEESYFKYVKTINETFQILKRTIEPYYYGDTGCIYDNREASQVQGDFISLDKTNRNIFLYHKTHNTLSCLCIS